MGKVLWKEHLAILNHAFLDLRKHEALDWAVDLCEGEGVAFERWMNEALIDRAVHDIDGDRRKRKGRRTNFLRNVAWYSLVQGLRDSGMQRKEAIFEACKELRLNEEDATERSLTEVYVEYQKLLRFVRQRKPR